MHTKTKTYPVFIVIIFILKDILESIAGNTLTYHTQVQVDICRIEWLMPFLDLSNTNISRV